MNGRLVERAALDSAQRGEMLVLLRSHFEGITVEQFEHDLEAKSWVILVEDTDGRIRGFSTLMIRHGIFRNECFRVFYSGDTIMDRQAWGTTALLRNWYDAVHSIARCDGGGKTYWLLICSGYRTYRILPVFWREFWPRHDAATPPKTQTLMDRLTSEHFGHSYDRDRGLVRLPRAPRLRDDLCQVPTGRLRDPHVAFFMARNPGWRLGDELVCLCDLSWANLNRTGRRVVDAERRTSGAARSALA